MNNKGVLVKVFFVTNVLLFNFEYTQAHGGGGTPSHAKNQKSQTQSTRDPAMQVGKLAHVEILKIMDQKKSPQDVAIVTCTLNTYGTCRGLDIALFDEDGHQILNTNSGSDGVVGFEGLEKDHKYEVRVMSIKYKGSALINGGSFWNVDGDRIVE